MTVDMRPSDKQDGGWESEGSDTVEYETGITRRASGEPPPRRNRGYWVDPSHNESSVAERPRLRQPLPESPEESFAESKDPEARKGSIRRRRLLWSVVVLVVLAGIVTVAALLLTGYTVVPGLSEKIFPINYEEDIALAAQKYGQDPYLIAAVVKAESGYDPEAVSRVGAVGLMQVMPDTAAWVAGELSLWQGDADVDLLDPSDNVELGACYLAYLGQTFGDGTQLTLAAYNAGPGTVAEWIEAAGGQEEFDLADIRFPETRHYVERVEHYRLLYMRIHPDIFGTAGISDSAEGFEGGGLDRAGGVATDEFEDGRSP